jgi:hypothetical protein
MIRNTFMLVAICSLFLGASAGVEPSKQAAIFYEIAPDGSAVVSKDRTRGEIVATDVAYILTGIAHAPGGDKTVIDIMRVDR